MAGIIPLGYQTGVYDSALLGILQDCVKLPQFLDAIFSFLARRTDFYVIMEHEKAKMGFPLGVAENMVLQVRWEGAWDELVSFWGPTYLARPGMKWAGLVNLCFWCTTHINFKSKYEVH